MGNPVPSTDALAAAAGSAPAVARRRSPLEAAVLRGPRWPIASQSGQVRSRANSCANERFRLAQLTGAGVSGRRFEPPRAPARPFRTRDRRRPGRPQTLKGPRDAPRVFLLRRRRAVRRSPACRLGIWMGMHEDFTLAPVHAHINLLGWVTLALYGLYHRGVERASNRPRLDPGRLRRARRAADDRRPRRLPRHRRPQPPPSSSAAPLLVILGMALFLAVLVTDLRRRAPAGARRSPAPEAAAMTALPTRTRDLRQLHLRQPQLGPLPAAPRRRRDLDLLQVRHHLDAEHPAPPRLSRRPAPVGRRGLALARPADDDSTPPSPASRRRPTAASSRATCRSTACPSTRRCATSSSSATRATSSCRSGTTIPSYTEAQSRASTPPARRRADAALPGRHPRALAALDQRGLVPVAERGLAALGQPLPHRLLVALPPPAEHPLRPLRRPARRPARRDRRASPASSASRSTPPAATRSPARSPSTRCAATPPRRPDARGADARRLAATAPTPSSSGHQRPLARRAHRRPSSPLYDAAKARCLPPDCAAYLEGGRAAWTEPAARCRPAAGA